MSNLNIFEFDFISLLYKGFFSFNSKENQNKVEERTLDQNCFNLDNFFTIKNENTICDFATFIKVLVKSMWKVKPL